MCFEKSAAGNTIAKKFRSLLALIIAPPFVCASRCLRVSASPRLRVLPQALALGCIGLTFFQAPAAPAPTPSSAIQTNPPLSTLREFHDQANRWGENTKVRLRGTVTHTSTDKTFFIQEGGAAVYVFHKPE